MAEDNRPQSPDHDAHGTYIAERRLARVYAEALLRVALERNQVDLVGDELQELVGQFRADPQIEQLLASPAVSRSARAPIIQKAFHGKISDTLLNFLLVLNQRNRLLLLRAIRVVYSEIQDEVAKRVRVQVRVAAPIQEDQQQRLRETLHAALQKEPVLEVSVDPSLLGGLVVRIGDDVYDASVRTRIETIRNQLLARSSYEIQSRRDRFGNY